ncbi:MAG: hypothetical protein WC740_07095 [Verrucomicrobiia bacterium]
MKTKALVRFLNRAAHFEADMELADALSRLASLQDARGNKLLPTVDPDRHPRLATRKASEHNRKLACKHLNTTIRASYIKDIYEELGHYITAILRGCALKGLDGNRLIGDHQFSIDANTLLSLGSWDAVLDYLSTELFRKVESQRSTPKVIAALGTKLNLSLDPAVVEAALPYLEIRHILVHRDGIIDREFAAKHPQLNLKEGDEFTLGYSEIAKARDTIHALVAHIDEKIVQNGLVPAGELQP